METQPWKILLVEDDEDDYIMTRYHLNDARRGAFELIWKMTFEEGLAALQEYQPDIVLVDYNLDTHNGVDLVRQARQMGSKVPFILLTGFGSYDLDLEAMHAGASDYLAKNEMTTVLLERTLRYAMERRQSEEELYRYTHSLELLSQSATDFLRVNEPKDLYNLVASVCSKLVGNALICVNEYDPEKDRTIIRTVTSSEEDSLILPQFFPDGLVGMSFPFSDSMSARMDVGRLSLVEGGLFDLCVKQLPEPVCEDIEAALGLGDIYVIPFAHADDFLGTLTILTKSRGKPANAQSVETLVSQAGMALKRLKVEGERKRLFSQLEAERARLSTVIATAPGAILVTDEAGLVVLANPVAEKLYGPTGEVQLLHPDGSPFNADELPLNRPALLGQAHTNFEVAVVNPNGQQRYLLGNSAPIRDKVGAISGSVTIFQDITARMEAEQALQKANDQLEQRVKERTRELTRANLELVSREEQLRQNAARAETLVEISRQLAEASLDEQAVMDAVTRSNAGILGDVSIMRMTDPNGECLEPVSYSYNESRVSRESITPLLESKIDVRSRLGKAVMEHGQTILLERVDEEFLSQVDLEFASGLQAAGVKSFLLVPLRHQGTWNGSLSLIRIVDRRPFTVEDRLFLESLADRASLALANARLYKDLQQALHEEQLVRQQLIQAEKHTAISIMVGSVAHELNNPLQTIQNCLFLIEMDTPQESDTRQYITMAVSETRRIMGLVTQLRELYRPARVGPMQPVDVVVLLKEVKMLLEPHLQYQRVCWKGPSGLEQAQARGLADQLKQVFLNLSLNAIEAMQPGGGSLEVEARLSEDQKGLEVTLRDTGPGIPEDELQKIFEPFFTTKESGTGLGLPICQDIIQRHEGHIWVESKMGEGSAFTVWLPLLNAK